MSETLKPNLKSFGPGEMIFHEGEQAYSLFIIQKGQIRLFKPKGKGFIEVGVLRTGEVMGEMAFFEDEIFLQKRSCAASAVGQVELIEVPYDLLQKAMSSVNPWFKTIIATLVGRLKRTNSRLKELEDNHTTISYSGKVPEFEYLKIHDVIKVTGLIFLCFKSHAEFKNGDYHLNKKTLHLYVTELFQFQDLKLTTILDAMSQMDLLIIKDDSDRQPNLLELKSLETLRNIFLYLSSEKNLDESQRLRVSERGEVLLEYLLSELRDENLSEIPPQNRGKFTKYLCIDQALKRYQTEKGEANFHSLESCQALGMMGEVLTVDQKLKLEIDPEKAKKYFPVIKFLNRIKKMNEMPS